ncbi:hypothetical protein Syun_001848 [Stephania yunnanensis]|uniref:Uncharacterized protein n=1 Tax=Stephania yunnanensis TaxID=152371 RepID=A0AAP0LEK1_9MAGN
MEWYFGGENVPEDRGTPGYILPSGQYKLEGLPNRYINQATESTRDELGFDRKSSIYELNKEQPSSWTACEEFPFADWGCGNQEAYLQRIGSLGDQMEYQLDYLEEMDQTDGIFMRSVQEGYSTEMRNPHGSVGLVPDFECSVIPFDNSTDMITQFPSIFVEPTEMDSPNYFGNCHFSQSVEWESLEDDDETSSMIPDSEQKNCSIPKKMPITTVKTTGELFTSFEGADKSDTSLEASVLRQLEVVTSKASEHMHKTTRVCFRDALYRLARCSKQSRFLIRGQNEELSLGAPLSVHPQACRSGQVQPMELETNATDRIIANLMFNTFNCDETGLSSIDLSDEACTKEKTHVHHSKTFSVAPYHSPSRSNDAEVPIFGRCI